MFKSRKSRQRSKPKNNFSISGDEDNEEEEQFVVKASSRQGSISLSSNKNKKGIIEDHDKKTHDNLFHSRTGEYTKEKLNNLKAQNKYLPQVQEDSPIIEEDVEMTDIQQNEIIIDENQSDSDTDQNFMVPTSHAIARAKQKREKIRRMKGNDDDFIPLDDTEETTSRLIRETGDENESDPFEEFQNIKINRIQFGDPGKDKKNISKEEIMDIDDPDDLDWEKQQLNKLGVSIQSYESNLINRKDIKLSDKPNKTIESHFSSIQSKIQKLKEQKNNLINQSNQIEFNIKDEKIQITNLKIKLEKLLKQCEDLTEYKSFIHDLMKCFELNLQTIDQLESKLSDVNENFLEKNQEIYENENDVKSSIPMEKDEFGRDLNLKNSHYKSIYLSEKQNRRNGFFNDLELGFSSDDEFSFFNSYLDRRSNYDDLHSSFFYDSLSNSHQNFQYFIDSLQELLQNAFTILEEDLPQVNVSH